MSVRQYKSNVFAMLMENKEYALEVYNVLNDTNYTEVELVEIKKLNSGIMLSVRNDASFLLDSYMNLYEHQSTYNPNMPLRFLIYFSGIIQDIVSENEYDIFGKKMIPIPTPKFLVFYNGVEDRPEKETMKLSDAFIQKEEVHQLELTCQVYNINPGKNENIVSSSKVLSGYREFVEMVRKNICEKNDIRAAVRKAINECIKRDILGKFFKENRREVEEVAILDFTFERREELIRRDSFAEGESVGYKKGESVGFEKGMDVLMKAFTEIISGKEIEECVKEYGQETVDKALKLNEINKVGK